MKVALTLIGSLLAGFLLKDIFEARRKLVASLVLGATAFFLVLASVLLGIIDMALQYEAQGFILWNAILGVATLLLVSAVVCALTARAVFPKPQFHLGMMGTADAEDLIKNIEQMAAGFFTSREQPPQQKVAREEAEQEREMIRQHPRSDFTFEGQPTGFGQPVHP